MDPAEQNREGVKKACGLYRGDTAHRLFSFSHMGQKSIKMKAISPTQITIFKTSPLFCGSLSISVLSYLTIKVFFYFSCCFIFK